MMNDIKFITPEDCYPVRLGVLRKGLDLETAKFPEDYLPGSFHLGYFVKDELAGIVSCTERYFDGKDSFQLRGMAVLEKYQGKSIGAQLYNRVEEIAHLFNKKTIWCNARVSAIKFYEYIGFNKIGEEFTLPYAGSHYIMYKELEKVPSFL